MNASEFHKAMQKTHTRYALLDWLMSNPQTDLTHPKVKAKISDIDYIKIHLHKLIGDCIK